MRRSLKPLSVAALGVALLAPHAARAQRCAVGAKLDVLWNRTYYPATVKQGPDAQERCFIGYDGYGANWDEWVSADRMRARGNGQGGTPNATSAPATPPVPPPEAPTTSAARSSARVGSAYGARDPRTCADTRAPARGAISSAQAALYVTCAQEGVFGASSSLGLVEHVRLDVSAGRPYQHVVDSYQDIDPHQLVYPIRGSFTAYTCELLTGPNGHPDRRGRNCAVREHAHASGVCIRTTFGDWRCNMQDTSVPVNTDTRSPANNAAPPTG